MILPAMTTSRVAGWMLAIAAVFIGGSISMGMAADPPKPASPVQPEAQADEAKKPGNEHANETKPTVVVEKEPEFVVSVTGNGRPISNADVKIKLPMPPGGEMVGQTDSQGVISFKASSTGAATAYVIAKGWVSFRKEFTLTKGAQKLSLQLTSQPGEGSHP
jgi:hypothetical protein